MDWEELEYSFAEYIPYYGTFYSFKHIAHTNRGDTQSAWISGVDALGGVARDLRLCFEAMEPISVVVVHAMAESVSDKVADFLTSCRTVQIRHRFQHDQPKMDIEHVNVLIAGNTRAHCDSAIQKLNAKDETDFLGVLGFHQSVYIGKFNYSGHASDENIFLTFPAGMQMDAPCYIFTTFTKDAKGERNRPLTSIIRRLKLIKDQNMFQIEKDLSPKEFYWFEGIVNDKGKTITLTMYNPDGNVYVTTIERQMKSIP